MSGAAVLPHQSFGFLQQLDGVIADTDADPRIPGANVERVGKLQQRGQFRLLGDHEPPQRHQAAKHLRDVIRGLRTLGVHGGASRQHAVDFREVGRETVGHSDDLGGRAVIAEGIDVADGQEYQRALLGIVSRYVRSTHRDARCFVGEHVERVAKPTLVVAENHDATIGAGPLDGQVVPVPLLTNHVHALPVELPPADREVVVGKESLDCLVDAGGGDGDDDRILARLISGSIQCDALEVGAWIDPHFPLDLVELVEVDVQLLGMLQQESADGRVEQSLDVHVDQPRGVGGDPGFFQGARGGNRGEQERGQCCGHQVLHGECPRGWIVRHRPLYPPGGPGVTPLGLPDLIRNPRPVLSGEGVARSSEPAAGGRVRPWSDVRPHGRRRPPGRTPSTVPPEARAFSPSARSTTPRRRRRRAPT